MKLLTITYLTLFHLITVLHVSAVEVISLRDSLLSIGVKITESNSMRTDFFSFVRENPVERQFLMPFSISSGHLSFNDRHSNLPIVTAEGAGNSTGAFEATSYMKHNSSTLWGMAFYNNGKEKGIVWNETSDSRLLYPYLTADSIGGDIKIERYGFSGGYADRKGRWSWGAEFGYTAGLYYRNVDPRPKNVTGNLNAKVGMGLRLWGGYSASLAFAAKRYNQSNELKFVNETGEAKIYHATGLGTHYVRFAGTGHNARYSGWRYGGEVTLSPGYDNGFLMSAQISTFSFRKILTDINNLPLVKASDIDFRAEAGWRKTLPWGFLAFRGIFSSHRRRGYENIFGDPASSIYPVIGKNHRYTANSYNASLSVLWGKDVSRRVTLWVSPSGNYAHNHENYLKPARYFTVNSGELQLRVKTDITLPGKFFLSAGIDGGLFIPISKERYISSLHLSDDTSITRVALRDFDIASSGKKIAGAVVRLSREISRRFAVSAEGSWRQTRHNGSETAPSAKESHWDVSVGFYF